MVNEQRQLHILGSLIQADMPQDAPWNLLILVVEKILTVTTIWFLVYTLTQQNKCLDSQDTTWTE